MNIYKSLNEIILYIEEHLDKEISISTLAKMVGINAQSLQNVFVLITNVSLKEYIRFRRLSVSANDLLNGEKVMDVAIKYGYNSAISFSRSFTKFHGFKPSEVKKQEDKIKSYVILNFDEDNKSLLDMSYKIETKNSFTLYGVKKETNEAHIGKDAPFFFRKTKKQYEKTYGPIKYGMVSYEKRFQSKKLEYWCLYTEKHEGFLSVNFPKSKWLIFKINSREARDIQNLSHKFYDTFFPKSKYKLKDLPELEAYKEGSTEFWIAIE